MARLGSARHALGRGGLVSGRARPGRRSRCAATNRRRIGVRGVPAGMVSRRRPVVRRGPRRMVEPPPLARRSAPLHVPGRARIRKAAVAARDDDLRVRRGRGRGLHVARWRRVAARAARPGSRRDGSDRAAVDEHRFARGRWLDRRVHRRGAGSERRGGERGSRIREDPRTPRIEHAFDRRRRTVAPRRDQLSHRGRGAVIPPEAERRSRTASTTRRAIRHAGGRPAGRRRCWS